MKKIYLLIIIVAVILLALLGYYRAIPRSPNSANAPRIEVSPVNYDFGEIAFGVVAKQTFRIKNAGESPLEIKRISTSCSCTTGKVGKNQLAPGEETELSVEYDTKMMGDGAHGKGEQERIVFINSNDPATPQAQIIIKALVK